jgi:hypothetical protein
VVVPSHARIFVPSEESAIDAQSRLPAATQSDQVAPESAERAIYPPFAAATIFFPSADILIADHARAPVAVQGLQVTPPSVERKI